MAKKDQIAGAFNSIIGDQKKTKRQRITRTKDNNPPVSLALEVGEVERLDLIAKELDQSRHAVLLYAVRDFINRYDQGERPKTKKEIKITLDAG